MPNFDFLKGPNGNIDLGRTIGFILAVAAAVAVASRVPGLKKVV